MDEVPISKGILYQKYANVRIAAGAFGLSTTARSRYIYMYTLSSWEMSLRVVPVAFEITLREALLRKIQLLQLGPFCWGEFFGQVIGPNKLDGLGQPGLKMTKHMVHIWIHMVPLKL